MAGDSAGDGAREGETAIRPSPAHRRRAALSAGALVAALLSPLGLILGLLSGDWAPLFLFAFSGVVVAGASFIGQGHNQVFVGPEGIRRVARSCDLTAPWGSLRQLRVRTPGERIVVFSLTTTGIDVRRLTSGHSNAAEALVRHPPEGFDFRLDRASADRLVEEIARRRPELSGIADWSRSSRP